MTNTTEHFVFFSFLTHNQHSEKGRMRERWREWRLKMFWQKREMSSFDSQWSKNTLLRNTYTRRKEWERNGRRWNGETRRIKELKNRVIELNVNISVLIPTAWCTHTHTQRWRRGRRHRQNRHHKTNKHHFIIICMICCAWWVKIIIPLCLPALPSEPVFLF